VRILILGGTQFVGRHIVERALARGHEVTLFTRGRTGADLFPDVARLIGDRDGGLGALAEGRWDAVVDTSGFVPEVVGQSVDLLADRVGRYLFVSTKSVYASHPPGGVDEDAPLIELDDPAGADDTVRYGGLKVLCERVVQRRLGSRALILRPGLVVGPHDPTDRFTYWPARLDRGGEVLAPGPAGRPIQFIDGRDFAVFAIDALEAQGDGVFNVLGPAEPATMGDLVAACAEAAASDPHVVWADDAFLLEAGLVPYRDLPLWMPDGPGREGFMFASAARARATGWRPRPLADTVADTLAFARTLPADHAWRAGLDPDREAALVARHGRRPS